MVRETVKQRLGSATDTLVELLNSTNGGERLKAP